MAFDVKTCYSDVTKPDNNVIHHLYNLNSVQSIRHKCYDVGAAPVTVLKCQLSADDIL